jgi:hypothetical protein
MIKIYTSKECIATVNNTNGFSRQVFHFDDIYPEELSSLKVICGAVTYFDDNGSVVTLGDPSCLAVQGSTPETPVPPAESPVTE